MIGTCFACNTLNVQLFKRVKYWWCIKCLKQRPYLRLRSLWNQNLVSIVKYLQSHPCIDCGETDIIVLEFDHVRGVKKFNVCSRIQVSWDALLDEINKCEIRCANCHRRATAMRSKNYRW